MNEYECTIKKESLAMYMIRMIKTVYFLWEIGAWQAWENFAIIFGVFETAITTQKGCYLMKLNIQDLNKQIEEFFKENKEITKIPSGHRAIPEHTWYRDTYPKNFNKVNKVR